MCSSNLGGDDRFAVVDFSRYIRTFDEELRPAADAQDGIDYVQGIAAGGNTNISGALERGLEFLDGERPGTVIFLTDGLATVGIEEADGILEVAERGAPERTQLFAFGVGYDVDTVLLDALASTFTGSSHYVTPEERIDTEVAAALGEGLHSGTLRHRHQHRRRRDLGPGSVRDRRHLRRQPDPAHGSL